MINLVIISAPSGAGKTSICRSIEDRSPIKFSVSCTTRPQRPNETDGVDYYFISEEEFQYKIENDEFVESENVHGFNYGTLKAIIGEALVKDEILLFEVDVKGAMSLKNLHPENTLSFFILPPSTNDLRKRLISRGTDSPERIDKRLERLEIEIDYKKDFDFTIVNDDVERASNEIISIINTQNKRRPIWQ